MAQIDVQRKKKSPLPWIIIALIVLGALAYYLWSRNNDTNVIDTTNTTQDSTNNIGRDTSTTVR
jgi:CHASE3 domain sensor protein